MRHSRAASANFKVARNDASATQNRHARLGRGRLPDAKHSLRVLPLANTAILEIPPDYGGAAL